MSIIIQTGHSSSHANKLMQMLYERGLSEPIKSHTHGLSAHDITEKLTKVLNKNESIINTKIVDNLIVDLLLANLDQDDWGWSDENNIHTLPCWQQSDDNVRFILVFDSPKLLLKNLLGQNITTDLINVAIQDWMVYHDKLLTFFENHTNHCLLIEGDLAINNLMNVKKQIQAITTNLKLKTNWQLQTGAEIKQDDIYPMFDVVADEILKQYPDCMALYEQLIEKSSIRLKTKHAPVKNHLDTLIQSLNLFNEQENLKKKLLIENEQLQVQILVLLSEKEGLQKQLTQDTLLLEQSKTTVSAEQKAQIEKSEQENKLLITQLHQVQEELERYYLENQKLKSEQKKEPPKPVYYGAADRVKADLPYRLGATMVSHSKSAKDLAVLPLALAKEYREFQKHQPSENLPAIEEYQDAHEAEKVKKHLSYRLGKTLVDGLKSPKSAIDLPVKLGKEIVRFGNGKN